MRRWRCPICGAELHSATRPGLDALVEVHVLGHVGRAAVRAA